MVSCMENSSASLDISLRRETPQFCQSSVLSLHQSLAASQHNPVRFLPIVVGATPSTSRRDAACRSSLWTLAAEKCCYINIAINLPELLPLTWGLWPTLRWWRQGDMMQNSDAGLTFSFLQKIFAQKFHSLQIAFQTRNRFSKYKWIFPPSTIGW